VEIGDAKIKKAYPSSESKSPAKSGRKEYTLAKSYQKSRQQFQTPEKGAVRASLEDLVREGAQKMLAQALEEEVNAFLGRGRYERGKGFRGYRNGYHESREVTVGVGPVEVRVPRVTRVPAEVASQGFHSQIVQRYQRASQTTQRLFARLYLEGLSTGDFEPVFRELVGETTALSASTIVRLKGGWETEYVAWRERPLWDHQYPYIWADGVYLGVGSEPEKNALLCILGAREDGQKELIAMSSGYRESKESWAEVLQNLRQRGLEAPSLAVGDGGLGLWAALSEVYPTTEQQRCWNHRIMNVQDKLPKRMQPEARNRLREIAEAKTESDCELLRDSYVSELKAAKQKAAAETILRDWDDFVTFYHYPIEHWVHLRTSNPMESVFSGVRLRTNAAKRMQKPENCLYLVFKIVERLSRNWRTLNGGANLMALVLERETFVNGLRHKPVSPEKVPVMV
jgi:transposase-like protein